jgi:hypothetical protein
MSLFQRAEGKAPARHGALSAWRFFDGNTISNTISMRADLP